MSSSDEHPVAIIGAGIVGVSTAIHLQRAGRSVVLIDRLAPGEGASYGNGGVLASCSIVPVPVPGLLAKAPAMLLDPDQPLFMRWRHLPAMLPWLVRYLRHGTRPEVERIAAALQAIIGDSLADHQALARGTEAERFVQPADYMYVYRDRAHFEEDAFGWSIRRANGIGWEELGDAALRTAEPAVDPTMTFGARFLRHGRISDPGAYVKALARHLEANGGRVIRGTVEDFVSENGTLIGLRVDGETISCSAAVLATGAWSPLLGKKLGLAVPIESERGYHMELIEPSIVPNASLMIAAKRFVITPMEGRLRLAGIVEYGGLDEPPSEAPFRLLERHARATLPGLTFREKRTWMGHRPAIVDSIPMIGALPGPRGLFIGAGHHHVGLTGGPRTGQLLATLISGGKPNIDMSAYDPARFASAS